MKRKRPGLYTAFGGRSMRTTMLVRLAITSLQARGNRISKSSVVDESKKVDETGIGISPSALRKNADAWAIFISKRTWVGTQSSNDSGTALEPYPQVKAASLATLKRSSRADLIKRILCLQEEISKFRTQLQHYEEQLLGITKHPFPPGAEKPASWANLKNI